MANRGLTGNAANPKDIRFAERVEQRREQRTARALREVLETPAGRIVFAQLIRQSGVFRSIWSPNVEIHFNAGRQSMGLELRHALQATDEDLFDLMDREERVWLKQQRTEREAAQTARAGDGDEGDE